MLEFFFGFQILKRFKKKNWIISPPKKSIHRSLYNVWISSNRSIDSMIWWTCPGQHIFFFFFFSSLYKEIFFCGFFSPFTSHSIIWLPYGVLVCVCVCMTNQSVKVHCVCVCVCITDDWRVPVFLQIREILQ